MSDYLTDPARARFRAAQRVAIAEGRWVQVQELPEGEELWREDGDSVRLTPDEWLVYCDSGKAGAYTKRLRATPELVAELRAGSAQRRPAL